MATLHVRLQPGASVDRVDGWRSDASGRPVLAVRVRARPADGAANEALLTVLARALDRPRSALSLARGAQSRLKAVVVEGLSDEAVAARLTDL